MRYNKIRKMDISNGPGIRVSIFMQGCTFNCKGCFNTSTHSFNDGILFTDEVIDNIISLAKYDYIVGLSVLGGEPLHPNNIEGTIKLVSMFKEKYPTKSIWLWTGYLYDELINKDILKYIDVLVDGRFVEELANPTLKWKGSSNQRVIDIKKTIKNNKIYLYEERGVC